MASPSVLQASTFQFDGGNATSFEVTRPAGLTVGNTLLVLFTCDGNRTITMTADGLTHLGATVQEGSVSLRAGFLKVGGSEPTTLTITTSGSERACAVVYEIQNAADPTAIAPTATSTTGASANPDLTSHTPVGGSKDFLWVAAIGVDRNKTIDSFPSNMTIGSSEQLQNGGGANSVSIGADTHQATAPSFDPATFGISGSDGFAGMTIAIFPPDTSETITATKVALAITPQPVTVNARETVTATKAALAITPQPVTVNERETVTATKVAFSITPKNVDIFNHATVTADVVALTITPQPVNVKTQVIATKRALTITPQNVDVSITTTVAATVASLSITPKNVDIIANESIAADVVALSISPKNVTVNARETVTATKAALAITPQNVTVNARTTITATKVALILTPQNAFISDTILATAASLTITPQNVEVTEGNAIVATMVVLTITPLPVTILFTEPEVAGGLFLETHERAHTQAHTDVF